jgi:hypothetical protein
VRIISGKFRGKVLAKSDHLKLLRPTTDKNREALFNILASAKFIQEIGFVLEEANVLVWYFIILKSSLLYSLKPNILFNTSV